MLNRRGSVFVPTDLLHADVRGRDLLTTEVLDLGVQIDVFPRHVSGTIQSESAGYRTGLTATTTYVLVSP